MAENKVSIWQYINTALLTLVLTIVTIAASLLNKINKDQQDYISRLVKLETTQIINVTNVSALNNRVTLLEQNRFEELKVWVEQNYVRKAQK